MIKKYVSLTLSLVFLISHSIQACDFPDIIEQIRPDRSSPLIRQTHKGDVAFNEYWVSGQDSACGFHALGFSGREDAIDRLLIFREMGSDRLRNRLQHFIQNSIISDKDISDKIFGYTPDNLEEFSKSPQNQETYLNYFKRHNAELAFTFTHRQDGSVVDNDRPHGLINALAMIQGVNLYIYTPLEGNRISLSHCFTNKRNQQSRNINLIYRNAHYNTLALVQDKQGNQQALGQENLYLEQLRQQLQEQQIQQEQLDLIHTSPINDDMLVDDQEGEETDQETLSDIPSPSFSGSPQATTSVQLTNEQVFQFIRNYYSRNIGLLSFADSCNQAYQYLLKTPSIYSTFALTRLVLDKGFTPQGQGRQEFLEQILAELKKITSGQLHKTTPKQKHYAKVFQGKVLVQLGKMQEAYNQFLDLKLTNKNFTQTYLVDMAEMIINYDFVPEGMSPENTVSYAQDILNNLPRRGYRRNAPSQAENTGILESLHLNTVSMRNQVDGLIQKATNPHTSRLIPTTRQSGQTGERSESESESQRQNKGQSNTTSHTQNRGSRVQIHPIYIPQKPTQERILDMRDQRSDPHPAQRNNSPVSLLAGKRKHRDRDIESRAGDLSPPAKIARLNELECSELASDSASDSDYNSDDLQDLLESSDNDLNDCQRLILLGRTYGHQRDNKQAITHYREALGILGNQGNPDLRAQAYIGLGNAHDGRDRGITHYREALGILGNQGNPDLRAQAYIGLGHAHDGENNKINHYREALEILGAHGSPDLRAQAHIGLGHAHDGRDRGITHYREALKILGTHGSPDLRAKAYIGLGHARDGGDNNTKHYRKTLGILGNQGNPDLRAQAYIGLGNSRDGRDRGITHYREALKILGAHGSPDLRIQAYIGLGNAFGGQKKAMLAIENFETALKIAREYRLQSRKIEINKKIRNAQKFSRH